MPAPVLMISPNARDVFTTGETIYLICTTTTELKQAGVEYKFYFNDVEQDGSIADSWTLQNLKPANSGQYTCLIVSEGEPSPKSNVIEFTVTGELPITLSFSITALAKIYTLSKFDSM